MGTKHKRHRQSAPDQLFARAQRELAKGNAKEALKDAKVCFRSDASPQHRQLLEQAYLGRAQQLHGKRLVDEAGAVLDELAALVPTAIEVNQQLARLRVLLGKGGAETTQLLQDDPSLLAQLVDDAVLDARAIKLERFPAHDAGRTGAAGIVGGGAWGGRGGRRTGEGHSTQLAVERLETVGAGIVGVLSAGPRTL